MKRVVLIMLCLMSAMISASAVADVAPQSSYMDLMSVSSQGGTETYSANLQTLIMMTMLTFLPAVIVMFTPFMKCLIVFGLMRQAMGTMHSPPNQVVIGISLMVAFLVMNPTLDKVYEDAYQPYEKGELVLEDSAERGLSHLKTFWLSVTSEKELIYFSELMEVGPVDKAEDLPLKVVLPSFVYSELTAAFKVAFLIFLPFLIIDIVVASTLMGMGMMMLSPMIISLPFKIFSFVLLDGWGLLTSSLIGSYKVF